jgi:endonuclease G
MASHKNSRNVQSSIQIDKWLWVITIGSFLYFAYTEGLLKEFWHIAQEILSKEIKNLDQHQDKQNNKEIKDKKRRKDTKDEIVKVTDDEVDVNYDAKNFNPERINELEFPLGSVSCQIIRHKYYALCYADTHEQASWVAYRLEYRETQGNADRQDDHFKPDDLVSAGSALPTDYLGSGYDRGHLAPAADFIFSENALAETFYMSNMSPQKPEFNRGIWKELEQKVRFWIKKEKILYIVAGGVLKNGLSKIGKQNKITVPDYFYKIIVDLEAPEIKAIAFLMPNEGSQFPLQNFVVTIDEIEKQTGIDFFPKLPDELEKQVEASLSTSKWFKSRR